MRSYERLNTLPTGQIYIENWINYVQITYLTFLSGMPDSL